MLSKSEQVQKEAKYHKDLEEGRGELKRQRGWKKQLILKLVEDLKEAETVPTDRICGRIIQDLQREIDEGEISSDYIWDITPAECKQSSYSELGKAGGSSSGRTSAWTSWAKKRGNQTKDLAKVIKQWTDTEMQVARTMPPSQLARESRDYAKRMIIPWNDDKIYVAEELLKMAVPVLEDRLDIVKNEARNRRKNAKILTK